MISKYNNPLKYVYHYTLKDNVEKILKDKKIKANNDKYTFFCSSFEDCKLLFNNLMCKKIKYIDDNLQVQERAIQNPEDYVILKIKCNNNNNFYTFNYSTEEFNPYNYSIMHLGSLEFDKLEVLEINESTNYQKSATPKIKKGLIAAGIIGTLFIVNLNTTYATTKASWLDNSAYYDIGWYNETSYSYDINTPEKLAGLVHLVNDTGVSFESKVVNITGNIDVRKYQWETLAAEFKGTVEGIHKIILSSDDPQASYNSTINGNVVYEETLNTLQISNINIAFNKNTTQYSAEVENSMQIVEITCSSDTGNLKLTQESVDLVLQNNVAKSINLKEGNNKVEITVKDADAIEKKYVINILRKQKPEVIENVEESQENVEENVK